MNLPVEIKKFSPTTLVGLSEKMCLADNKTFSLWQAFMKRKSEIKAVSDNRFFSIQNYPKGFTLAAFTPHTLFDKIAAVEVSATDTVPGGMLSFNLEGGLYAVFSYKGSSSEGQKVFRWIFSEWLPASGYELDDRPHFEILGEKYKNNDPDSEEEICIPIKKF